MNPVGVPAEANPAQAVRITSWQRRLQRWAGPTGISLGLAPLLHAVDRLLLDLTGDRICLTTLATGIPVLLIRTRGARSGRPRTRPLTALADGERLALIASNFGRRRHPGWFHNLRATPRAGVRRDGRWRSYSARPAEPSERPRFWQAAVTVYPGYADYARRAAPRQIPILILEPLEA